MKIQHHVLRTVPCPGCGYPQDIRFRIDEVQVVERCVLCGKVATFERSLPGIHVQDHKCDRPAGHRGPT